jgi:hypothetical protein
VYYMVTRWIKKKNQCHFIVLMYYG